MQIELDRDEVDILALTGDRDRDLREQAKAIEKQGRRLGRKMQRVERERQNLRARLLQAVRRNRPDLTIPDNAAPSMTAAGKAVLSWPDPAPPKVDAKIPAAPATLPEGDAKVEAAKVVGEIVAQHEHARHEHANGTAVAAGAQA